MMRRFRPEWILAIVLLITPQAVAQQQDPNQPNKDTQGRQPNEDEPIFVFEITPQLLGNGLDKLVEKRLAKDYDLDEYQYEEMRQLLHKHVPKFLREHRAELQGLWVEWTEAISADEPPDPEYVADWAGRLLPIVEQVKGMVDVMSEDMRGFLDDRQQVLLDGYLATINVGTQFATNQLHEFAEGGFEPERHWVGYKHVRHRHRDPEEMRELRLEMEHAREIAMTQSQRARSEAGHQTARPPGSQLVEHARPTKHRPVTKDNKDNKDEWERYVEDFVRHYELNDEQKQKAYSHLRQQTTRRESYLGGKAREFQRIKKMFENAKGDKRKLDLAEAAIEKLYKPVERMFEQLKQKLDTLPTRGQRKAAADSAKKNEAKQPKPAPTGAADRRRP